MDDKIVAVHQPNFLPWFGYFVKIINADLFIFLDDVPISNKTGYVNSTNINLNGTSKRITIPIRKPSSNCQIGVVEFADQNWDKNFRKTLFYNYKKHQYFDEFMDFWEEQESEKFQYISELNINIVKNISLRLGIETSFKYSSDFRIKQSSAQRIIKLVQEVSGNIYLSGQGGKNYQEEEEFLNDFIELRYLEKTDYIYSQNSTANKGFIPGLSILDVVMNIGFNGAKKLVNENLLI